MKRYVYLFLWLFWVMGFEGCRNEEVDKVKSRRWNDVEGMSGWSCLMSCEEGKKKIGGLSEGIEGENRLLEVCWRGRCMEGLCEDYDFCVEEKIRCKEKGGIV